MFASKLIKSDNELMIEIGENGKLWKRTSTQFRGEIEDWSGEKISDEEIAILAKIKWN